MRYDEDTIAEARREAAMDRFDRIAVTCVDCGERWDPGAHSATRVDPAYCNEPECPHCGGEPFEWMSRDEQRGVLERYEKRFEEAENGRNAVALELAGRMLEVLR